MKIGKHVFERRDGRQLQLLLMKTLNHQPIGVSMKKTCSMLNWFQQAQPTGTIEVVYGFEDLMR